MDAESGPVLPQRRWVSVLTSFCIYWLLAFLPSVPAGGSVTWRAVGTVAFAAVVSAAEHCFPQISVYRLAVRAGSSKGDSS